MVLIGFVFLGRLMYNFMSTIIFEGNPLSVPEGTRFLHYKGSIYEFVSFCTHSETQEDLVIYKSTKDGKLWARPASSFFGRVLGTDVPLSRFSRLEEPSSGCLEF